MKNKHLLLCALTLCLICALLVSCTSPEDFPLPDVGTALFEEQDGTLVQNDVVTGEDMVAGGMTALSSEKPGYGLVMMNARVPIGQEPPLRYFLLPQTEPTVVPTDQPVPGEQERRPDNEVFGDLGPFERIIPIEGWGWFLLLFFLIPAGLLLGKFLSGEQNPENLPFTVSGYTSDATPTGMTIGAYLVREATAGAFLRRLNFTHFAGLSFTVNRKRLTDVIKESIEGEAMAALAKRDRSDIAGLPADSEYLEKMGDALKENILANTGFELVLLTITGMKDPSGIIEAEAQAKTLRNQVQTLVEVGLTPDEARKLIASTDRSDAFRTALGGRGVTPTVQVADMGDEEDG